MLVLKYETYSGIICIIKNTDSNVDMTRLTKVPISPQIELITSNNHCIYKYLRRNIPIRNIIMGYIINILNPFKALKAFPVYVLRYKIPLVCDGCHVDISTLL